MRVFLSSTYDDLKFERRFIIRKLRQSGFDVVSMETDFKRTFDWRQWSANQARQCELCIFIFDKRVGTQGNVLFGDIAFHSISRIERDHARNAAFRLLEYKLERPFPDQEELFSADERNEYLETLGAQDAFGRHIYGAEIECAYREGAVINNVDDLARRLESDTRIPWAGYLLYRVRHFRRSYLDNTFCAWQNAYEDESHISSTDRLGLSWRLRSLAIWSVIAVAVVLFFLPLLLAMVALGLVLAFLGLAVAAYRPSFIWVGTKTVMARGALGRFKQGPTDDPPQLRPHWLLLDRWTGLGALCAKFADGTRVFVPLVNDPNRFVRELPARIKERKERPLQP